MTPDLPDYPRATSEAAEPLDDRGSGPAKLGARIWCCWTPTVAVTIVATGLVVAVWWWFRAPRIPDPPPIPTIQDEEVSQALEAARRAVLANPRSGSAWGHLGMVFLAHLFDREAVNCFTQAAVLDPRDPMWPYGQGQVALKRAPDKALVFLEKAVAIGSSQPAIQAALRLQLAEALQERQDLDGAEAIFREVLTEQPANARAAFGLGLITRAKGGDLKIAEELFLIARVSPYARKIAPIQLASLARARGDDGLAMQYEMEIAKLPDDPPWPDPFLDEVIRLRVGRRAWDRQLMNLERQHRYAEAAQMCLDQLKKDPQARSYLGAGVNLARLNDFDQAMPLLRKALELDPDNPQAQYTLALALYTRAEKELIRAPDSPRAKEWFREAIEHARRATELKPDHAQAYMFWGLGLKQLGDFAGAVKPLEHGVASLPGEINLQLGLGEVLLELGKLPEAEKYLENARKLDLTDPRPGMALERLRAKKTKG